MGRVKANDTMARLWHLLEALPKDEPGITAADLERKLDSFDVQRRTIERDLVNLSTIFPIDCNDDKQPYRWRWMKGRSLSLPALTISEALSLCMLEQHLKTLLPMSVLAALESHFEQAKRQLSALTETNTIARWADKVRVVPPSLPLRPPTIKVGILEVVQEALLKDVQIACLYQPASSDQSEARQLHPLALVQRGPVMYLVASASRKPKTKLYALHRFDHVEITEEPVKRPDGFDIDSYIAKGALQFGNGKMLKLKAGIAEDLAVHLMETPLSGDMQIEERDEEYLLTATVPDSWQLRWWLLSWGASVEVLGPKGLRNELAKQIYIAHQKYTRT